MTEKIPIFYVMAAPIIFIQIMVLLQCHFYAYISHKQSASIKDKPHQRGETRKTSEEFPWMPENQTSERFYYKLATQSPSLYGRW